MTSFQDCRGRAEGFVTPGNMTSRMLVGVTYWFIYLRKVRITTSKPQ